MSTAELEQRRRELQEELQRQQLLLEVNALEAQLAQGRRTLDAPTPANTNPPDEDEEERRGRSRERPRSSGSSDDSTTHRERKKSKQIDVPKPELYYGKSRRELTEFTRACEQLFEAKPTRYDTEKRRVLCARGYLRGEPQDTWYRKEDAGETQDYTWKQLKELLLNELLP
jgi:hypothetical protein